MLGSLDAIRARFNAMADRKPPAWRFERDRQHWTLILQSIELVTPP